MTSYRVEQHGHIAVLTMNSNENRFNPESIQAFTAALDQIEHETRATALIVTSSHDKIWCNGLDINWLLHDIQTTGEAAINAFMSKVYTLLRRILTFPMPTIACITGHAFGAGAFLAFAHDMRFMRADRGWICFPEADMGLTLGPVFMALAKRIVPLPLFEEMQYTARRIDAATALDHRIIKQAYPLEELKKEACAYAKNLTRPRDIIHKMKLENLGSTISAIDEALAELDKTNRN